MMNFDEYLEEKGIKADAFKRKEPTNYAHLAQAYLPCIHPRSFSIQKLFLLNALRRKYSLKTSSKATN